MVEKRNTSKDKAKANKKQNSTTNAQQPTQTRTAEDGPKISKVTLLRNPIKTIHLFSKVIANFLAKIIGFVLRHSLAFALLAALIIVPHLVHGRHTPYIDKIDDIVEFALYWILLGVASSIGLGTGLHTFVLYLGPHIAKITMVANECNAIPEYLPSRWAIRPNFEVCPPGDRPPISFFTILLAVQIESFLWGLGTALGELPPYFVARAASIAGKTSEELEGLDQEGGKTLIDKAKVLIYRNLQKYGFLTIVLCASIPNPLFDLAGLTCGHFGIPFLTFFTATAIGKAIIKVHLQMIFVIFMFTHKHVDVVLQFFENNLPFLRNSLSKMLEKQKDLLHSPPDAIKDEKPIFAQVWDIFIFCMVAFFVVSIIESLANAHLEGEQKKAEEKKGKKEIKKEKVEPKQEKVEPKKEKVEPKQEKVETKKETGESKKEKVETKKETGETKKEKVEPKKEAGETKKEKVETKKENVETKKEKGETKKGRTETKKQK